ncbi:hypothetical protein RHMOL_Rhmol08G0159600 [Rhododendron molle]|uniref:Uncharacterized protein n=1 Tax=Rhododendron molle TaxID=49168 RepID=A0ACC0MQ08_RHOML|nr:hypothetical protein RHMOL_Rhmol08G0159600 [Rhododendron molle]
MVEVEDPHPSETTLGLGPFGEPILVPGGVGASGKAHMSIGVRAGTSTQDVGSAPNSTPTSVTWRERSTTCQQPWNETSTSATHLHLGIKTPFQKTHVF